MPPFKLELVRPVGDSVPVLAVEGELDLYTSPEFDRRLRELSDAEPAGLVVDLGRSTFVDSSACRALLRAARRLAERDARLVVVNRDQEVARMFEIMGLDAFLIVVASTTEAGGVLVQGSEVRLPGSLATT
jgi:anti-sigma B factor antagonist